MMSSVKTTLAPKDLCALVCAGLDDDLAEDIITIDLKDKTSLADYMVIATGRNARHINALAEHLCERLKSAGARELGIEGKREGNWILVDAGDVIVHLFREETRAHYDLEKLWDLTLEGELEGDTQPIKEQHS